MLLINYTKTKIVTKMISSAYYLTLNMSFKYFKIAFIQFLLFK